MSVTRLAVKRLTASDLTFFEWHYRNRPAGNQKAINLNADVFVDELYPGLPETAAEKDGRLPLDLFVYGPGLAGEYNLQRKVIKHGSYKNWRLDGEFIYNPEGSPDRFNILEPRDFVVFEFSGSVAPTSARAVFLARNEPEDQALWQVFDGFVGGRSMVAIDLRDLKDLITRASPSEEHPIRQLILDPVVDEDLEDAAMGGSQGASRLYSRPVSRRLSAEKFRQARAEADRLGELGEALVNAYLSRLKTSGEIAEFRWVSRENAVAPYDFEVEHPRDGTILIDVKSTAGEFSRRIHLSLNELRQMLVAGAYHVYRVYEIGEDTGKLRVAEQTKDLARGILAVFDSLPEGVSPDGVSLPPELLDFGPEIDLEPAEEPEQETTGTGNPED